MNQNLRDYIRHLSKQDRKTFSQKVLKVGEEFGELAKVALPFDNAYATNHRFTERGSVLEEAVDTILCALSVAYDLDFTDDELDEMLVRKAEKWATLQHKEANVKYPLPYEIHVTVSLEADQIAAFKRDCQTIGVKPIVLDLQTHKGGTAMEDVMTSSKHFGNNKTAYLAAMQVVHALEDRMYKVVRTKIETVPWHPAAPNDGELMPPNCYFEAHFPITVKADELALLYEHIDFEAMDLHLSRNVFKVEDGVATVMATLRMYREIGSGQFQKMVEVTKQLLENVGLTVGKTHTEFSIYDTKVSHDAKWISYT